MKFLKDIRENLKDPKKRSLTLLGFYALFFIFVFIVLNYNSTDTKIEKEMPLSAFDQFKNMTSYNFKINYYKQDSMDIVEGTYYKNKALIHYNLLNYYYEGNYYLIDNDSYYLSDIQYNVAKIFNTNLSLILDKLEEESKTTYKDGKIEKNYTIDSNYIYNYLYGLEGTYESSVKVSIIEINKKITNVSFDLTSLMTDINKIDIEYSNIDEITGLEFNKENYLYRE